VDFKTKKGSNGKVVKVKAILIAKGFQQTQSVDHSKIFAPIVCWSAIHFILYLAAMRRWKLCHMDVVTTFNKGSL
jgi:hypothetical protein